MTLFDSDTKKPLPVAIALGFLGGIALVLTTVYSSSGPIIYIPYAALIIAIFAELRALSWSSFFRRFATSLLTFMVATIILYLFIVIFDAGSILEISVWGHIWRLGFMAVIGAILSLPVAYLADIGRKRNPQLAK